MSGSPPPIPPKVRVLGLPVSVSDQAGILRAAAEAVEHREPLRIVVTNHNKARLATLDPGLRRFMEEAEVVAAESSMAWAARRLGRRGVGEAWGVALMADLLARADQGGWRVYLLGAEQHVLDDLAARMAAEWPGAHLVGRHHGFLTPESAKAVRQEIQDLAPDLLLVALGSPKQEIFMARLPRGAATVTLGVGGSFDVHAGRKKDAPDWVRGSGFEWLYRAVQSPRLLKRYAVVIPWFIAAVARERLTGRTPPPPAES